MVPWSHLRQPFLGWVLTVSTSELTHFNLVIHLSKLKQLALRFFSHLKMSCCSCGPRVPRRNACLPECNRSELPETSVFAAIFAATLHHVTTFESGRHTSCRCGFLPFWFSGEVKHIVHLIRWNLKAVLCPYGWLEHGPGAGNNRTTPRNLGTESWSWILYVNFITV